jgi:hypothetical protein
MTPAEVLLQKLEAIGAHARLVENPTRVVVGPESALTPELKAEVEASRRELAALLAAHRASAAWSDPTPRAAPSSPLTDPRPDLAEDSAAWSQLLEMAEAVAPDLFGVLDGIRCCGCRLTHDHGGWRLVPLIDASERRSLWQTHEAWEKDRARWLLPFRVQLIEVLRRLPPPDQLPTTTNEGDDDGQEDDE